MMLCIITLQNKWMLRKLKIRHLLNQSKIEIEFFSVLAIVYLKFKMAFCISDKLRRKKNIKNLVEVLTVQEALQ